MTLSADTLNIINNCSGCLSLSCCKLNAEDAKELGFTLKDTQVHTVDLYSNNIGPMGAKELGLALKRSPVHTLYLGSNKIGPAGAKELGIALKDTQVHTLGLSCNNIGAAGAKKLGLALKDTQVRILDLGSNNIGDAGAKALGLALHGSQVHTLFLGFNNISAAGAKELVLALKGSQVHTLDLGFNNIDAVGVIAFAKSLEGSQVTKVLGVSHPELDAVLKENLLRKKNCMMALGQAASGLGLNENVVTEIVNWLPEGRNSGIATTLACGSAAVEPGFDVNAAQTAIHAMSLERGELKTNERGWNQAASILRGETKYLNDDTRVLRRMICHSRDLFFNNLIMASSNLVETTTTSLGLT